MECQKTKTVDGVVISEPKHQYETLEEAIKACKIMNSLPDRVQKLVSYKCPICYKFHIGRNGKMINPKEKLSPKQLRDLYGPDVKIPKLPRTYNEPNKDFVGKVVGFIDLSKINDKKWNPKG